MLFKFQNNRKPIEINDGQKLLIWAFKSINTKNSLKYTKCSRTGFYVIVGGLIGLCFKSYISGASVRILNLPNSEMLKYLITLNWGKKIPCLRFHDSCHPALCLLNCGALFIDQAF